MIRKILLLIICLACNVLLFAQKSESGMASEMRSNGKIYVVVAVLVTIFLGIIIYLVRLDRKISKLENNINS
jgi:hypothetical protein